MRLVELADAAIDRLAHERERASQREGSSSLSHRPAAGLDLFNCRARHASRILQDATAAEILDCVLPLLTSEHLDVKVAFADDGMINQRVVSAAGQHLWAFLLLFAYAEQLRRPDDPSIFDFLLRTLEGIDTVTLQFARRMLIQRDPTAISRRAQPQEQQSGGQLVDGLLQLIAACDHAPSALNRVRKAIEQYGEWAAVARDEGSDDDAGRPRFSARRRLNTRGSAGAGLSASAVAAAVAASVESRALAVHGKRRAAATGGQMNEEESKQRFKRSKSSEAATRASPASSITESDMPSPVCSPSPTASSSGGRQSARPHNISSSPPILSPASAADLQLAAAVASPHPAAAASATSASATPAAAAPSAAPTGSESSAHPHLPAPVAASSHSASPASAGSGVNPSTVSVATAGAVAAIPSVSTAAAAAAPGFFKSCLAHLGADRATKLTKLGEMLLGSFSSSPGLAAMRECALAFLNGHDLRCELTELAQLIACAREYQQAIGGESTAAASVDDALLRALLPELANPSLAASRCRSELAFYLMQFESAQAALQQIVQALRNSCDVKPGQ